MVMFMADYGVTKYDIGAALGHFGIAVPNVSINFPVFVQFIDTEMTGNLWQNLPWVETAASSMVYLHW